MTLCVPEDEHRRIIRDVPIVVDVDRIQPTYSLCRDFELVCGEAQTDQAPDRDNNDQGVEKALDHDDIVAAAENIVNYNDTGGTKESLRMEYQDFAELDNSRGKVA